MVASPLLSSRALLPRVPAPCFLLRRTPGAATLHHLTLLDAAGVLGHWVLALGPGQLRQLPARVLLLWADPAGVGPLEDLEEGAVRFGGGACAATEPPAGQPAVADGRLWLDLRGERLRGAFRLHRDGDATSPVWWLQPRPASTPEGAPEKQPPGSGRA